MYEKKAELKIMKEDFHPKRQTETNEQFIEDGLN